MRRTRLWDTWSKVVVSEALTDVLRHSGVDLPVHDLHPRPSELPGGVRHADLVLATADRSSVVHVEIQQRPDAAMGRRMLGYAARIAEHPDYRDLMRSLVQIVVQVTGADPMDTRVSLGRLHNECHVLHVPSVPASDLLASGALAPLALVSGGASTVRAVAEGIARVPPGDLQVAMAGLALSLDPEGGSGMMRELRRSGMTDVLERWKRTEWFQELLDEARRDLEAEARAQGRATGHAEGHAEGHAAGRAEGRAEGEDVARLAAVVDVLAARFPETGPASLDAAARRLVDRHGPAAVRFALSASEPDDLEPPA